MDNWRARTAVLTGAGSGFGLEMARQAARLGMNLVLVDVQVQALNDCADEMRALGAQVLAVPTDVAKADQVHDMAQAAFAAFGAPHLVFNNAGVASGGLVWETSLQEWDWVLGVNLMGVVHGVHAFTPMMLQAAQLDPDYRGFIVNTASMAGLLTAPNMGVYNVSKHAVVALSETLYHDLALVSTQIHASVLCPYFVPTGISQSERNRPAGDSIASPEPTASQRVSQAMTDKAVRSGKVSAADVALQVFDALAARRFYIYSHAQALAGVQQRFADLMQARNPTDPYAAKPHLGQALRSAINPVKE